MKISLFQFNPIWEDKISNQEKILEVLHKTRLKTDILIFPEMTLTGFTMRSKKYSEANNSESVNFFQKIAKENKIHIFAGYIEDVKGKYFNCFVHADRDGNILANYHKIHPFSFSGEDRHFTPGNTPVITEADGIKIGLSICYDLRFPELFRQYGKKRVTLIINIANWPVQRIEHWLHLLKARAIENLCYMIGVNRTGKDKGNEYNGCSAIYGPLGEEVLLMSDNEKLITIEINQDEVLKIRNKFPFLNDMKII